MKIGELAAATGCHFETIRYYEKVGLLPKPERTASGHRAYRKGDIARVRFITRGRALGFSLDEIRGKRIKWLILPLHESETDRHLIGLSG
jgi:MerR family mercuric resistance operon transcriptional regulator